MNHEPQPRCQLGVRGQLLQPGEVDVVDPARLGVVVQLLPDGVEELADGLHVLLFRAHLAVRRPQQLLLEETHQESAHQSRRAAGTAAGPAGGGERGGRT